MIAFVRRRPVLAHYLLSLGVVILVVATSVVVMMRDPASAAAFTALGPRIMDGPWYINVVSIAQQVPAAPLLIGVFVFASAPSVAALVVAGMGGGGGLRRLLSRLKPVGPDGGGRRAWLAYGGVLAGYAAGFALYDFIAGPGVDPFGRLQAGAGGALTGAVAGLFLDEGGSLEELGWRGFEAPLLQQAMTSPRRAALWLGVLHWAWHLPREAPTLLGGAAFPTWLQGQVVFLLLCVALSVVAVFASNLAGGSVWPAIFVHGGSNVWSKAVGEAAAPTLGVDLRSWLLFLAAAVILVAAGRRLGRPAASAADPGAATGAPQGAAA